MLLWQHVAVLSALSTGLAFGQLSFEIASVKPAAARPGDRVRATTRGGPGTPDPGQITFTNVTLTSVLLRAYDLKPYQLTGPDWLSEQRYDFSVKVPPGTTRQQLNQMLQSLLAQRFHLALHHETRQIQGYELAAGKNGPKLKTSTETDPTPNQLRPNREFLPNRTLTDFRS